MKNKIGNKKMTLLAKIYNPKKLINENNIEEFT